MFFKKKEIDFIKETEEIEQKSYLMVQSLPAIGVKKAKGFIFSGIRHKAKDWIKRGLTNEQIMQPYKDSPTCVTLFAQLDVSYEDVAELIDKIRNK